MAIVLAGTAQLACASWVSIKVTAPTDGGGPYTDAHFYSDGDGDSEGFQSQVALDFSTALFSGFSSHLVSHAKVGMVFGDFQPEGICFFFGQNDLVQEGDMLEIALNLNWVNDSDDAEAAANFNTVNMRWSRAGGALFGGQGPTITHFDFGRIAAGGFDPIKLVPGEFDGQIQQLNQVPVPSTLWLVLLGLFSLLGWTSSRSPGNAQAGA